MIIRRQRGSVMGLQLTDRDPCGLCEAALLSEDNKWVNAQRIEVSDDQSI